MYANGNTLNYTIEYQKDGEWIELDTWERSFAASDKLDETLANALLTIQNDKLVDIAPFTLFRITITETNASGATVASGSRYMYSSSWAGDAANMSAD